MCENYASRQIYWNLQKYGLGLNSHWLWKICEILHVWNLYNKRKSTGNISHGFIGTFLLFTTISLPSHYHLTTTIIINSIFIKNKRSYLNSLYPAGANCYDFNFFIYNVNRIFKVHSVLWMQKTKDFSSNQIRQYLRHFIIKVQHFRQNKKMGSFALNDNKSS